MSCACIRGTYDFDLTYTTCKDIVYIDRSTWQEGVGFDSNISYSLKITLPDGSIRNETVVVGQPLHLDFGNCPEPGVYNFAVETCGEPFYKDFPILCTLECGRLKAAAKLGRGADVKMLRSIRERIELIEDSVSFGDIISAREHVDTVKRDLKRINCECAC